MKLTTDRLNITLLSNGDAPFIYKLVNSELWLKYIGQRNINNIIDAENYIQKINNNPQTIFWTVSLLEGNIPIGLLTLIKRDYLDSEDFGFAFLPDYHKQGYAYEASKSLLKYLNKEKSLQSVYAITLPENTASIKLLEKLELRYLKDIKDNDTILKLYQLRFDWFAK